MKIKLRRFSILPPGIARKFIIYILIFSSVITLILTLIQLYMDYKNGIASIEKSIKQVEISYIDGIRNSLWLSDMELLKIQMEGMLKLSDMQYLQIIHNNTILAEAGVYEDKHIISKDFILTYTYADRTISIGTLRIIYTLKELYRRLLDKVIVIILSQTIKTFLVSIFIFFIFYILVGKHLRIIAKYLHSFSLDNLENPLVLNRPDSVNIDDELNQVISSFNTMRINLIKSIKEREAYEEKLRKTRNYLDNVLNSMPSVLIGVDPECRITHWNFQAQNITGLSSLQIKGQMLDKVFPVMSEEMAHIIRTINKRTPWKEEKVLREIKGQPRYSDITIYPLITNGIDGAVIRLDDVTDRVRMEEMMIQTEKMMSVGGLAAGMAHEINNPLAGILQNVQVMRNRLSGGMAKNRQAAEKCGTSIEAIHAYMEQRGIFHMIQSVIDSGMRAADIVENMLGFSRKSDSGFAPNDMCGLMDRTINLASSDYDLKKKYDFRKIRIIRDYDKNLPPVPCDTVKIQQVFLNILKNGAQAMSEIKETGSPPCFIIRICRDNDMACIQIQDNGPGMNECIRKRIFEPFFTTKPVGVGTGLGLSVSYFIITENHGGTMSVESNSGSGTKFIIRMPFNKQS